MSMVALMLALLGQVSAAASPGAGVGARHRLHLRYPAVTAGTREFGRELVQNDHPTAVRVTATFEIDSPCGSPIIGDPVAQTVDPNGGTARWDFAFPTPPGCFGTYTVIYTVYDQYGEAQDTKRFKATP
jgi:hypothetical protein